MGERKEISDYELELLIQEVESTQMLAVPKRLKSEVLQKSSSLKNQVSKQVNETSMKLELLFYGLKIAVAVPIAILMFGIVNQATLTGTVPGAAAMERIETTWEQSEAAQALNWLEQIKDFGRNLERQVEHDA